MNPQELLGRDASDAVVEATMTELGTLRRPYIGDEKTWEMDPSGRPFSWVKVYGKGVEFIFCDTAYYEAKPLQERLSGDFTLTGLGYYKPGGWNDFTAPAKDLPFGLTFNDQRETARHKLLQYEGTRRSYIRDLWDVGWCELIVQYGTDNGSIERVMCTLPMKPWPAAGRTSLNVTPETWIALLGSPLDDPELSRVLAPINLRAAFAAKPLAKEVALDFKSQCGLVTSFVTSDRVNVRQTGIGQPGGQDAFLALAGFHAERDQDISRRWTGPLPFGIEFNDAPDIAYAKVGVPAHDQIENREKPWAAASAAFWHFKNWVLRVCVDTDRNCVRHVSIIDRKYWEI
jgi:hypothetical protein